MKQTKKPTRVQKKFLEKRGVDVRSLGVRIVTDTKDTLTYMTADGKIFSLPKV